MRKSILLLLLGILWAMVLRAQDTVCLGASVFVPAPNAIPTRGGARVVLPSAANGQHNVLVQFDEVPSANDIALYRAKGLQLEAYVGGKAYWALLAEKLAGQYRQLRGERSRLRAVLAPRAEWKMGRAVAKGLVPLWAQVGVGHARMNLRYAKNVNPDELLTILEDVGCRSVQVVKEFRRLRLEVPRGKEKQIASLPYVLALEYEEPPAVAENWGGADLSGASILRRPTSLGGRDLHGEGIRIGMWDANVDHHPDFGKRLHTMESESPDDHGTHVAGSIMGAGLLDARARGMADRVELWSWNFNRQRNGLSEVEEMAISVRDFGITFTQNSYGMPLSQVCPMYSDIVYNHGNQDLDRLALENPTLLHVFAAGNDQKSCPDYSCAKWGIEGFGTGSKRCKNTLYVGAVDQEGG